MEVQAQYPSNLLRGHNHNNNSIVLDEFQQFHRQWNNNIISEDLQLESLGERELRVRDVYASHYYHENPKQKQKHQQIPIGSVFSEEPESELTNCINPSRSGRKRNRSDNVEHDMSLIHHQHLHSDMLLQQQHHFQELPPNSCRLQADHHQPQVFSTRTTATGTIRAGGLQPPFSNEEDYEDYRLLESRVTSTSGRTPPSLITPSPPLVQNLAFHLLHQQNLEIDTLIKLHNEKLRLVIQDTQKRHCRSLISYSMEVERRVVFMKTRLDEKEAELESAIRRNSELEEKVKQMSAENLSWFNLAKNNEAIVSTLRSTLEHILARNDYHNGDHYNNHHHQGLLTARTNACRLEEGFGDSEEGMMTLQGGATNIDAQSYCCYQAPAIGITEDKDITEIGSRMNKIHHHQEQERIQGGGEVIKEEVKRKSLCKACHEKPVSVLLLPCRHLCLCKDCDSKLDSCPLCNSVRNASLQIFMA